MAPVSESLPPMWETKREFQLMGIWRVNQWLGGQSISVCLSLSLHISLQKKKKDVSSKQHPTENQRINEVHKIFLSNIHSPPCANGWSYHSDLPQVKSQKGFCCHCKEIEIQHLGQKRGGKYQNPGKPKFGKASMATLVTNTAVYMTGFLCVSYAIPQKTVSKL